MLWVALLASWDETNAGAASMNDARNKRGNEICRRLDWVLMPDSFAVELRSERAVQLGGSWPRRTRPYHTARR